MPIHVLVDHHRQLVLTTCVGLITLPELVRHARALFTGGLLALPQLVDARDAVFSGSEAELGDFSGLMAALRHIYGRPPVAFVGEDAHTLWVLDRYAELGARANLTFRVFEDVPTAEAWIVGHGTGPDPGP